MTNSTTPTASAFRLLNTIFTSAAVVGLQQEWAGGERCASNCFWAAAATGYVATHTATAAVQSGVLGALSRTSIDEARSARYRTPLPPKQRRTTLAGHRALTDAAPTRAAFAGRMEARADKTADKPQCGT